MNSLNNLEFWQILVLLVIIILAAFGLILLLIKLFSKTNIKVKVGNNEISAEGKDTTPEIKKEEKIFVPTIVDEQLQELEEITEIVKKKDLVIFDKREFAIIVNKIKEVEKKQTIALIIEKIEKQMKCAVERTDELMFLLSQNFMFELTHNKKFSTDGITFQIEYKVYTFFLDNLKEKMKNIFRLAFKENNFESYTAEIFNSYIESKSILIAKFIMEYFTECYFPQGLISKEEVLELHRRVEGKQREVVNNIFMNAKRVFEEIRQKLINLDMEMDNFIFTFASRD